ncbi:MAG: hypothetical protein ABJL54_16075 [Halioglobus sp.]
MKIVILLLAAILVTLLNAWKLVGLLVLGGMALFVAVAAVTVVVASIKAVVAYIASVPSTAIQQAREGNWSNIMAWCIILLSPALFVLILYPIYWLFPIPEEYGGFVFYGVLGLLIGALRLVKTIQARIDVRNATYNETNYAEIK